jgi:kynurenine formamidase
MTPELLKAVAGARLYDLAQEWRVGMPHWPSHPPFLYGLRQSHGDVALPGGGSSASEILTLGGHVGTHIDALCHFSCDGRLHGGTEAAAVQSVEHGFKELGIQTVEPIVRRGVLFDVAGTDGELPADRAITASDLQRAARTELRAGDVALIRTGWARYWDQPRRMANHQAPGPNLEAATWLSSHSIFAAGSDTLAFEAVPAPSMPVHVHLLVEKGIHIIEALNLERLAAEQVYEFLFVASPLKIRGGTGSPIRPFALV